MELVFGIKRMVKNKSEMPAGVATGLSDDGDIMSVVIGHSVRTATSNNA